MQPVLRRFTAHILRSLKLRDNKAMNLSDEATTFGLHV